jgi:hypothetical protein
MWRKSLLIPVFVLAFVAAVRAADDPVVGQVGGEDLRASTVLAPLEIELYQLSLSMKRDVFLGRARGMVDARLSDLIVDTLLVQRARQTLSEEQQRAIELKVQEYRDQLSAQDAAGGVAGDNPEARAAEFTRLSDGRRNRLMIQAYVRHEIGPQVVADEDAVRRYFERFRRKYQGKELDEVRPQIEEAVKREKYRELSQALRAKVRAEGEFTDPAQIADAVMRVVEAKFPAS